LQKRRELDAKNILKNMAKIKIQQIEKRERYEIIGDFYDIVTNLKAKKEVIGFFMGLLTPSEALMLARRIQIATMLLDKKGYDEIQKKLKVGVSTIITVSRWLYGENEQFQKQIQNHKKRKKKRDEESKQDNRRYYNSVLDRYPGHRLLKDILGL